jgi:hypothetical protein
MVWGMAKGLAARVGLRARAQCMFRICVLHPSALLPEGDIFDLIASTARAGKRKPPERAAAHRKTVTRFKKTHA